MSNEKLEAQLKAARAYEALFVPALFAQWALKTVEASGLAGGQSVLDVACGTGIVAHAALLQVGSTGYIAGLDPNIGMLAVAKELTPTVDWRQGTAESIPFPDASFDVVACQFGLMFMDSERALREMLRVLKPQGRLVVAVWDRIENIPAYAAEVALVERLAGMQAADALRAPFALGDRSTLTEIFHKADATPVSVLTSNGIGRFPSIRVMVEADLRGWLPVLGVNLAENVINEILTEAESVLGQYVDGDGLVTFDVAAHLVTATKH